MSKNTTSRRNAHVYVGMATNETCLYVVVRCFCSRYPLADLSRYQPAPAHQQPSPPYTNATVNTGSSRIQHDGSRLQHSVYGTSSRHPSQSRDRSELDRDRQLSKHLSNQHIQGQHPYEAASASASIASAQESPRYPRRAPGYKHGYDVARGYHPTRGRSGSHSSAESSQSIDEMLLEATTDQKGGYAVRGRVGAPMHGAGGPGHPNDGAYPHFVLVTLRSRPYLPIHLVSLARVQGH